MIVLVLGASGMLGHKIWQTFAERFDTHVTFRQSAQTYNRLDIFNLSRTHDYVSADNLDSVNRIVSQVQPEVVVNCIGIVKQDTAARDPISSITVNSLFPHQLAALCRKTGARLIHLSTDCVFTGRKGNYSETDTPDALDLYGRTKLLGETNAENCLTIRTSMIGRELNSSHGLVEWFIAQRDKKVKGFKRAIFSGFPTVELAGIIGNIIEHHPQLQGIWHVAADPINKFNLLMLLRRYFHLNIEVEPDENFACDRSLDGGRFRRATGFEPRPWPEMIERMAQDKTPYEEIRRIDAS